jgi:Domain of unknown function (DUF4432)
MKIHRLANDIIRLELLPEIGGAITKCFFAGKQIFATSPYGKVEPAELADETEWVKAWNGGWQLAIPNAGSKSLNGDYPQGFHGNASQDRWQVELISEKSISLRWQKEELDVSRNIQLLENKIAVECAIANIGSSEREIIITEHLIFGDEFIKGPIALHPVQNSAFVPLDYYGNRTSAQWENWGTTGWEELSNEDPPRMGVLKTSGISLISGSIQATVDWNSQILPYLWLWQEFGKSVGEPWNGLVQALGIEPAMTDNGLGMSEALRTKQALRLAPGAQIKWHITLTLQEVKNEH